jgi:cysteine-rich repeat protein
MDPGEDCDDGNRADGDGCSDGCAIEPGYVCRGEPSVCEVDWCGNGLIGPGEECDDGNASSGDGCSDGCVVEPGYLCVLEPSICVSDGEPDQDGDTIPNIVDNCPTIFNTDQNDLDGDGVGSLCDNCVTYPNPRATYPAYRTTTGGQLDDEADGYGNLCDAGYTGPIVTALDTIQFKGAVSKPITGSNCGSPPTRPCDKFDLDGKDPVITALDIIRFRQLLSKPIGPKCAACPLECVGDACP